MSEVNKAPQDETKLEDILKSIRGIIDDHNQTVADAASKPASAKEVRKVKTASASQDEQVLELTTIADFSNQAIISKNAQEQSLAAMQKFAEKASTHAYVANETSLEHLLTELMKPMLKDWLDNNLPRIVEKVVSEEIKRLVPKQ